MLRAALLGLCACLALTGCVETVKARRLPGLKDRPVTRIAVAPFAVADRLSGQEPEAGTDSVDVAAALVARHMTEALSARGVQVIPAGDMERALSAGAAPGRKLVARTVAETAQRKFGADAVLMGELTRYVERRGQARGATRGASVGFRVRLVGAPGAEPLWAGQFDETQQALTENLFSASRLPGRGSRWLTAEELARWGAQETAKLIPISPPAPAP